LYTTDIPDSDLITRTGGEMRLSNFLIWKPAYAEIYFTLVLWPDFDKNEMDKALIAYTQRQRRFSGLPQE
jgi:undecaprenyl diphosphate synthase